MKIRSFITILSVILLAANSCENKFHMPFKETDQGKDKVSFYLDGVGMRSFHQRGYLGMYEQTTYSWSDSYAYVFKSSAGEEGTGYGWGDIIIDIRTEYPEKICAETRYEVTEYIRPETEDELELYYSTPHLWIFFDGIPASEGWVKFRRYTNGVASGNFEIDFIDSKGVLHTIRYGNFDSAPASFADYTPYFPLEWE